MGRLFLENKWALAAQGVTPKKTCHRHVPKRLPERLVKRALPVMIALAF